MKKNKRNIIIISLILLVLITVISFSYAYVAKNARMQGGNINQTISFEGEYNLTTYGNTNTNINLDDLDFYGVNYDKTLFEINSSITLELHNEYEDAGTTCSYNYVWVWDEDSDNYIKSKEAEKEFTISGLFNETQISNYNESIVLGSGKIATTNYTLKTVDFTTRFYNLKNIDQSAHIDKIYKGSIRIAGIRCSRFQADTILYYLEHSCATRSGTNNEIFTFGNSCVDPTNYALVDNSDLCEENALYRIISTNILTGETELVKASDVEEQTWSYWANNNFSGKTKIVLNDDHFISSGEGVVDNPFYYNKNVKTLYSINVSTSSTFRTNYNFNEALDVTGLTVNAVYTDGSTKTLTKSSDPTLGYVVSEQKETSDGYGYELMYTEYGITKKGIVLVDIATVYSATGSVQTFTAPRKGYYQLDVWGAQGGTDTAAGGYGGYSTGMVFLNNNQTIYIYVGKVGANCSSGSGGGYNGGGNAGSTGCSGAGGGATHIATTNRGVLSTYNSYRNEVLIVAGGGGGDGAGSGGAHAGGFVANSSGGPGGTQFSGAAFGQGGGSSADVGGGGGGWYGGYAGNAGGGGSGYIGNTLLTNKEMYCYNCTTATGYTVKTSRATSVSSSAIKKAAKSGNGAAIISYKGLNALVEGFSEGIYIDYYCNGSVQTFTAPFSGYYLLEAWGAQGGTDTAAGGYGGYSTGMVYLNDNQTIYIYVGNAGANCSKGSGGGYNGGGNAGSTGCSGAGGGATHIATTNRGVLSTYNSYRNELLIVAGGGGGDGAGAGGGHAGGYTGKASGGAAGTQSTGYSFGQGGSSSADVGGGGGGFYGGHAGNAGGGGSGYIANTNLLTYGSNQKMMLCYNCAEDIYNANTFTIKSNGIYNEYINFEACPSGYSSSIISKCAKAGQGNARITLISRKTADTIEVTLDNQQANTSGTKKVTLTHGQALPNIVIPTKAGYLFGGYFTQTEGRGTNYYDCDGHGVINWDKLGGDTLYAYWVSTATSFGYSGRLAEFIAPTTGYYELDVWGAQGGSDNYTGGYGGYSNGIVHLEYGQKIYVVVGGKGADAASGSGGGYNGGGNAGTVGTSGGGGGATHIATTNRGILSTYTSHKEEVLIVAGGGGGGGNTGTVGANGANAGGFIANSSGGAGGNQSYGYAFGQGGTGSTDVGGGGGGWYGGYAGIAGGGGSGYIGNPLLYNKVMYGYNVSQSSSYSTNTILTTLVGATANKNQSKSGNGYAIITYKGKTYSLRNFSENTHEDFYYSGGEQSFTASVKGYYLLEVWGAQGGADTAAGGYGGYSTGVVQLNQNDVLHVYVGNQGGAGTSSGGGYNGGGHAGATGVSGAGGGATHIATTARGVLSTYSSYRNELLIVAGGGGGGGAGAGGGHAGGYTGNASGGSAGTQSTGYSFGQGGSGSADVGGGGGGFYGGYAGNAGGGGSGYIANTNLLTYGSNQKMMLCYNCAENITDNSIFTIKTLSNNVGYLNTTQCPSGYSSSYIKKCAKAGKGNARITLLSTSVSDSIRLTLDNQSATTSGTTSVNVTHGQAMPTITSPTKTGFIFGGYYTDTLGRGTQYYDDTGHGIKNWDKLGGTKLYAYWVTETTLIDYSGKIVEYLAPKAGYYQLEVWGAQGGTDTVAGGYGSYSSGLVYLNQGQKIYIGVGGKGANAASGSGGGYNGGGNAGSVGSSGAGGGATHIATANRGLLSAYSSYRNEILIVAGGGGGDGAGRGGAHAGGFIGRSSGGAGGSQTGGAAFGRGGTSSIDVGGGGGGYYGGYAGDAGGGGSGYIGNTLLYNKVMYCYGCTTSTGYSTKTVSTSNVSNTATTNYVKSGNGYARIKVLTGTPTINDFNINDFEEYYYSGTVQSFKALKSGYYLLQVWGAQGGADTAAGGYGGYSTGVVQLNQNNSIYVNVGNNGYPSSGGGGGYNGGGNAGSTGSSGGGGGATHIATSNRGVLSAYASYKSEILLVAGGGGGDGAGAGGAHGGGYAGKNSGGVGGTQSTGYSFGQGGTSGADVGGGGGGWYGGVAGNAGGGGSGYINNTYSNALINYGSYTKHMYCYTGCSKSTAAGTLTNSGNCVNGAATADCAKSGTGFAKITLLAKS